MRQTPPSVRIVRLGEIRSYEVLESDLNLIEHGPPESIHLAFTFFFLSAFITLLAALLSAPPQSDRVFYIFVILCVVSAIASLVFFLLWWPNRDYYKRLVRKIKDSLPPPGVQEPPANPPGNAAGSQP